MNPKLNKKSGFTLLEVIIVIIIIGVLASLALPRFFATVEFAKSTEALNSFVVLRDSIERCGAQSALVIDYTGCTIGTIDADDPALSPNAHFDYTITSTADQYTILAVRNSHENGDGASQIQLVLDASVTPATITRSGTGVFGGIH